jgi:spoIIIJ-associated protein
MKQIIKKGTDPKAIISSFRKEYRVRDWEFQYKTISTGSKGLFGLFGKKQAAVRFDLFSTEERVKLFLEQLFKQMEIRYDKITLKIEQKTIYATIENCSDAGFLIGKNGNMLEQLQYLVNRVFENVRDLERIYLDTEEYRARQEQAFLRNYTGLINKVKATGKPVTLDPMQPGERRIIHKYVEGDKALKTLTVGDGDNRRIVIMPAGQKEPETARQPRKDAPRQAAPRQPKPRPELTPEQKAEQSYKRHNQAHPNPRISLRPRRAEKARPPKE